MDIFISYSREDEAQAKRLYDSLLSEGRSVWLDKKSLLPGQVWETEIESAIKKSNFVILLLSDSTIDKRGFVQKEIQLALDVHSTIPSGQIFLIPVRLNDCKLPEKLQAIHCVDMFPNWDEGLNLIRWSFYYQRTKDILLRSVEELAPTPSDVMVVSPDEGLDPKLSAFLGYWHGRWGDILPSQLIVESITPDNATVVYTWGEHPSGSFSKGWVRKNASVLSDGSINWSRTKIDVSFTFKLDVRKDVIYGIYKQPQNISKITMLRRKP